MLEMVQVNRSWQCEGNVVTALKEVNLVLERGSFTVVTGSSGSGKSTLLLTLGGMQRPSAGVVLVEGRDLYAMSAHSRNTWRYSSVGFIFQAFHLVPYLSVLDNVLLGVTRRERGERVQQATACLDQLGIRERLVHRPSELSVGEQQRVAVARALVGEPDILLADEPTGNLDEGNARVVFDALEAFYGQGGTVVLVTHGSRMPSLPHRSLLLDQGRIREEST